MFIIVQAYKRRLQFAHILSQLHSDGPDTFISYDVTFTLSDHNALDAIHCNMSATYSDRLIPFVLIVRTMLRE
jgi:hypothetical protein